MASGAEPLRFTFVASIPASYRDDGESLSGIFLDFW
jgi:hypothetical protein